jgi:hypothetical protein
MRQRQAHEVQTLQQLWFCKQSVPGRARTCRTGPRWPADGNSSGSMSCFEAECRSTHVGSLAHVKPGWKLKHQSKQWQVAWSSTLLPTTICTTVYEQRPGRRVQVSWAVVSLMPCSGTAQGHQQAYKQNLSDAAAIQQPHPSSRGHRQAHAGGLQHTQQRGSR